MTGRTIKRHPKVYPEANTMNKSRHVTFRCTQKQYDLIKEYGGDNLSEWLVDKLMWVIRMIQQDKP